MSPTIIHCPIHGAVTSLPHYDLLEGGASVYRCPICERRKLQALKLKPQIKEAS